jgi:hypothetical protein
LDAILLADGPRYIDVNPRMVEPGNAWHSGVDLVDTLVAVSQSAPPLDVATGREGVTTHQLLLAVLSAAERGRVAVLHEVMRALARRPPYGKSTEELTPAAGDPFAPLPTVAAAIAILIHPPAREWFTRGAVTSYALTPAAWREICSPIS